MFKLDHFQFFGKKEDQLVEKIIDFWPMPLRQTPKLFLSLYKHEITKRTMVSKLYMNNGHLKELATQSLE